MRRWQSVTVFGISLSCGRAHHCKVVDHTSLTHGFDCYVPLNLQARYPTVASPLVYGIGEHFLNDLRRSNVHHPSKREDPTPVLMSCCNLQPRQC